MQEYFDLGHAEPVPNADLEKPEQAVFYLPMHAVNPARRLRFELCSMHQQNPHLESLSMISYWLGLQYILRWLTSCYIFVFTVLRSPLT